MASRKGGLLGTSRDQDAILEAVGWSADDLDDAVDSGLVTRTKITGKWLYAASTTLDEGLRAVEEEATRPLHPWLLGAIPYLRSPIAHALMHPRATSRAVELLLRELIREGRFGALGMLTNDYEPYLGLHAFDDSDEVEAQLEALPPILRRTGRCRSRDLPEPTRARERRAWRSLVLRHGEFLGLGRLQDGVLVAWE